MQKHCCSVKVHVDPDWGVWESHSDYNGMRPDADGRMHYDVHTGRGRRTVFREHRRCRFAPVGPWSLPDLVLVIRRERPVSLNGITLNAVPDGVVDRLMDEVEGVPSEHQPDRIDHRMTPHHPAYRDLTRDLPSAYMRNR